MGTQTGMVWEGLYGYTIPFQAGQQTARIDFDVPLEGGGDVVVTLVVKYKPMMGLYNGNKMRMFQPAHSTDGTEFNFFSPEHEVNDVPVGDNSESGPIIEIFYKPIL